MTGPFIAHETVLKCSACGAVFGSDRLLHVVPARSSVAYDVMVFVGRALFQRHRTTQETRTELVARNVALSASEVDYLGRKFIVYLAHAHRQATPRIREAMSLAGGYVLHLDATHEGDAPALMTGLDSLSKIVLATVKIPSEHAEHIVPFLRKIDSAYGAPKACVHDMGTGICKALSEVFPGVADFICHFHFLRDIGKDFLDPAYRELRTRLRAYSISSKLSALVRTMRQRVYEQTSEPVELAKAIKVIDPKGKPPLLTLLSAYSLGLWALHGKHSGDGYGFPFDRPLLDFAERILELHRHVPQLLKLSMNDEPNNSKHLFTLARAVSDVAKDPELQQAVEELRWRCQIFDSLRTAMRIAVPGGDNGLNDDGTAKAMSTIRQGVMRFRRRLEEDCKLAADPLVYTVTNSSPIPSKWFHLQALLPSILNAPTTFLSSSFVSCVVGTVAKPGTIPCTGRSRPCWQIHPWSRTWTIPNTWHSSLMARQALRSFSPKWNRPCLQVKWNIRQTLVAFCQGSEKS